MIFIALLLVAGSEAAALLARRNISDNALLDLSLRRLQRVARVAAGTLVVLALVRAALQVQSFVDPGDSVTRELIRSVLYESAWGHAWAAQLACVTVLAVSLVAVPRSRRTLLVMLMIAAAFWFQTGMGHPAGKTWPWPVGRVVDITHLVGAALWLGTLGALMYGIVPVLGDDAKIDPLARVIREFSVLARVGAALVVLSGAIATLHYGDSIGAFFASRWGRLLTVKIAALSGVAALGWYNWKVMTPALEQGDPKSPRRLRRAIVLELGLGLLMLAITTMLVVSPLPGE